jgi:hypothetical protein
LVGLGARGNGTGQSGGVVSGRFGHKPIIVTV